MSKKYIFGYGSLVSADDVARTLGRRPSFIYPVTLDGWIREWGILVDNAAARNRCVRLPDGRPAPGSIVVLNVRRPAAAESPTHPNGVLFEVTEADLRKIDARETHYRRVEVTKDIIDAPGGTIYTYSGIDKFLVGSKKLGAVIPGPYFDLVAQAFMSLGPDSHEQYLASTLASELLVFHESG